MQLQIKKIKAKRKLEKKNQIEKQKPKLKCKFNGTHEKIKRISCRTYKQEMQKYEKNVLIFYRQNFGILLTFLE